MSNKPDNRITEAEQWDLWHAQHPNPSGLPEDEHKPVKLLKEHKEAPAHHGDLDKALKEAGLPGINWIASPNYTPGRAGHNPEWSSGDPNTWITDHTMVGWKVNAIASFQSPARQASSHYLIGLDGSITQMVRESDAAWTNGTMAGVGSNLDSITIEHEDGGDYNGPRTPALYEASAQLHADIHRRHGIPLIHRGPGGGVLRHRECTGAQTACPDSFAIDSVVARANQIVTPPPPPPAPEWKQHLKTNAQTFALTKPVPIYNMESGAQVGTVAVGTLSVQYETTAGGKDYWVTSYGAAHADGLLKSDVAGALDTRPEWQRNLKPNAKTFHLYSPVAIRDLTNPTNVRGQVAGGTELAVAFETHAAGGDYWVTQYGSTHGTGLSMAEVQAASAPPPPPPEPMKVYSFQTDLHNDQHPMDGVMVLAEAKEQAMAWTVSWWEETKKSVRVFVYDGDVISGKLVFDTVFNGSTIERNDH